MIPKTPLLARLTPSLLNSAVDIRPVDRRRGFLQSQDWLWPQSVGTRTQEPPGCKDTAELSLTARCLWEHPRNRATGGENCWSPIADPGWAWPFKKVEALVLAVILPLSRNPLRNLSLHNRLPQRPSHRGHPLGLLSDSPRVYYLRWSHSYFVLWNRSEQEIQSAPFS